MMSDDDEALVKLLGQSAEVLRFGSHKKSELQVISETKNAVACALDDTLHPGLTNLAEIERREQILEAALSALVSSRIRKFLVLRYVSANQADAAVLRDAASELSADLKTPQPKSNTDRLVALMENRERINIENDLPKLVWGDANKSPSESAISTLINRANDLVLDERKPWRLHRVEGDIVRVPPPG